MCTISKVIGINMEKEICLSDRECISGHTGEIINMLAKYIVHRHITAEPNSYWLLVREVLIQVY